MSETFHDEDIEFDFFEDLDTRERPAAEERERTARPPRPGRPPRRPVEPGLPPRARLLGLVAFAIVVVVLLVFLISSCGGSKTGKYASYMTKVAALARDSDQIGRELSNALTTPGIKPSELAVKLEGLAARQRLGVTTAEAIEAPGPLREEHRSVVEALRFRFVGLRALSDAVRNTAGSKDVSRAALQLAEQAQRLVASDIVWEDLFRSAAIIKLRQEGVRGIAVPDSDVAPAPDFGSPGYWVPVFQRVNYAALGRATGGLHGTGIVETKALPSGTVLRTDKENIVTAGTDLGFAVTVEDTGDSQEVQVKVTLTIQQQPSPIVATQTIDVIDPGQQKTVVFRNLGEVRFATKTTVTVDVKPVPGEANTGNNSASYPVIFSLG
ncbi:MAG: hypothetical protein C4306_12295 [Thermoleophilia bacterium]